MVVGARGSGAVAAWEAHGARGGRYVSIRARYALIRHRRTALESGRAWLAGHGRIIDETVSP